MPIPTTYTSDFGGPKIRKGENRGKGVSPLTPGLCRAATCLREAKIRKGESIDKQKELAPSQPCRAASCFSETRIVQSPRNVQVPAGRHRMKHLKTYGPAGKSIVCQVQKHRMPQAKPSYAITLPLALTRVTHGMAIENNSTDMTIFQYICRQPQKFYLLLYGHKPTAYTGKCCGYAEN